METGIFKTEFLLILDQKGNKYTAISELAFINRCLFVKHIYVKHYSHNWQSSSPKSDPFWKMLRIFFVVRFLRTDDL